MIKKKILKLLTKNRINLYHKNNSVINKIKKNTKNNKIHNFGKKNKNKIFYIINREGIGGLFSNLLFVLDHLIICEKKNYIPVVDWKNFPTVYSEKKEDSWSYYFKPVSKYTLNEVYKSQNVIFSINNPEILTRNLFDISRNHFRIFRKYIKIKPYLNLEVKNFLKKNNFKKEKWIGLHWRSSDMKTAPNHPFPPTQKQIIKFLNKYSKNKKIFAVVDEKKNLDYLKEKYYKRIIEFPCFRSTNDTDYYNDKSFYRKRHKYKQGKEIIIQALILSKLDIFIGGNSMVADAVKYLLNSKIKFLKIENGTNSSSLIHSLYLWKLKSFLPSFLGGFRDY